MPVTATFTRASVSYKQDGSQVAVDVPRYEAGHSGSAIMVEEGTTNLCLQSQTFDNASWSKSVTTVTPNTIVAPDGTTTADVLTSSGDGYLAQSVTGGTIGQPCTFSVYLKTASGTLNETLFLDSGAATKAITITTAWQRFTVTGVFNGAGNITAQIFGAGQFTSGMVVHAWGAQLEQKAYATSYMPTTTVTGTRAAESLTIPTAGLLNAAQGSIACWVKPLVALPGSTVGIVAYPSIGMPNNNMLSLQIRGNGAGGLVAELFNGYGSGHDFVNNQYPIVVNTWVHLCATWAAGIPSKLYVNGALVKTALQNSAYTFAATTHIGEDGNARANILIDDLRFYNKALTAAEVAQVYGGQA